MNSENESMQNSTASNLVFPHLRIKIEEIKKLLKEDKFKRIYFHLQYKGGNNKFGLIAYEMGKAREWLKFLPGLIEEDPSFAGNELSTANQIVFGQLELTNKQLKKEVDVYESGYLNFTPKIIKINPEYISYDVGATETNPSPPREPNIED